MHIHEYAYFQGDFTKAEDAKINVMTHGFMYGTSVFEGIRAYWNAEKGRLYLLKAREHFERLLNSCKILRIDANLTVDQMIDLTVELLKKNRPTGDTYVRPVWYKSSLRIGPVLDCSQFDKDDDFLITTIDLGNYVDVSSGLSVNVSNWRRLSDNAIPARAKVGGSYVNTALAKTDAALAGFDDSIFLTESGKVSEGSAMNLFIVRNGKLISPAITENILEGITRNLIAEIAQRELGLEVVFRQLDRTELYVAEEAFFVGTGAQIAPITKIDNYDVGDAKPGPIASKLQALYFDICRGNNPAYKDALIEIEYEGASV